MRYMLDLYRESANSLYLELVFDESSFDKYFEKIDSSNFERDNQVVPMKEGEIKLSSLKIVDKDFLYEIQDSLKEFENYLLAEFGSEV